MMYNSHTPHCLMSAALPLFGTDDTDDTPHKNTQLNKHPANEKQRLTHA